MHGLHISTLAMFLVSCATSTTSHHHALLMPSFSRVQAEEAESMDLRQYDDTSDRYDRYITELSDTVFAPCPAGNNLETFRHYEVLGQLRSMLY